jgi:hypothetical protein
VPIDAAEPQSILEDLDARMVDGGSSGYDHISITGDCTAAIGRLNKHKNDGTSRDLSTDHLILAEHDLAIEVAFIFTCMVIHSSAPLDQKYHHSYYGCNIGIQPGRWHITSIKARRERYELEAGIIMKNI